MDLEDIKLSEKTCLENDNSLLHIYEVSKVVKFIVVENKIAIAKTASGRNELLFTKERWCEGGRFEKYIKSLVLAM